MRLFPCALSPSPNSPLSCEEIRGHGRKLGVHTKRFARFAVSGSFRGLISALLLLLFAPTGHGVACPPGQSGAVVCSLCAAGKYTTAAGFASCVSCVAGSYQSATGATTTCPSCNAGSSSSAAAASCTMCSIGTFQPSTGQGTCSRFPCFDTLWFPTFDALRPSGLHNQIIKCSWKQVYLRPVSERHWEQLLFKLRLWQGIHRARGLVLRQLHGWHVCLSCCPLCLPALQCRHLLRGRYHLVHQLHCGPLSVRRPRLDLPALQ